jgi:hypothetical protein
MSNLDLSEDWILDNVFNSEVLTVETSTQLQSSEDTEDVIQTEQQHHSSDSETQLIQDLGLNIWLSSNIKSFIELYFVLKHILNYYDFKYKEINIVLKLLFLYSKILNLLHKKAFIFCLA